MNGHVRHQPPARRARRGARLAAGAAVAAVALAAAPLTGAAASARPAASTGATVWGWGDDAAGQLGRAVTGGASSLPVRARLPHGTRIAAVRAGCDFTVALTGSGQVLAWGGNGQGQLGRGTIGGTHLAAARVAIPVGTRITAVRAGCQFALALTSGGQVLAWGAGSIGQLGDGGTASSGTPVPVSLPPGTTVRAISTGAFHALALTTTGEVLAWGNNFRGELGDGNTTSTDSPVPVLLPPHVTVTAVAAGFNHSTALTSSGGVLAWGENDLGQLGDGSVTDRHTPVPARLPAGTKVTGLFGACGDTVALTSAGRVLSWGDNQFGQLGNNSTRRSLRPVSPRLPAGTSVTAVAAGCHHVLARTTAGRVLAWGSNIFREIGDGSRVRLRRLPTPVRLPAGVKVFAVAAGPAADCSLAVG